MKPALALAALCLLDLAAHLSAAQFAGLLLIGVMGGFLAWSAR